MCPGKYLCPGQGATALCPQSSQSPRRQSHAHCCLRLKEALFAASSMSLEHPSSLHTSPESSSIRSIRAQKSKRVVAILFLPLVLFPYPTPRCSCNLKNSFCFSIKQNLLSISMYANRCPYGSQHTGSANRKMLISNCSSAKIHFKLSWTEIIFII